MRTAAIALALALVSGVALAKGGGSHAVRGHVTRDGTYVPPHQATNPNGTAVDNWSTKGNTNPYTGKEGTKPLDAPYPRALQN